MNNDKRIILAIAVYAAVITMVLHTISSEGHERFSIEVKSAQHKFVVDPITPLPSTEGVLCTEVQCKTMKKISVCNWAILLQKMTGPVCRHGKKCLGKFAVFEDF